MTRRLAAATLMTMVGACLFAPMASAGGWATVGLSSLPDGTRAGEAWIVDLKVLQHGRTPLEGVRPAFTITKAGTDATRTFPAIATDEPGVYRARVVFPSAGRWRYLVDDDFSAQHSFGSVRVGTGSKASAAAVPVAVVSPDSDGGGGAGPWGALGAIGAAGILVAGFVLALRRRRPKPAQD
jgi:YtkA-like